MSARNLLWYGFLLALGLRLCAAAQPLVYLDRLVLPDDSYYTLSVARAMAAGHLPSADGIIATSGFQPLVAVLQIPFFWFSANPDSPVRSAIMLSAFFGALQVPLAGLLLLKIGNRLSAMLGMAFVMLHPIIAINDLNALETSLSGCAALACMLGLLRAGATQSRRDYVLLGLLAGLALLARVDNAFLVLGIGIYGLASWGVRPMLLVAGTSLLTVLPWAAYCMAVAGMPIPESGRALYQIIHFTHNRQTHAEAMLNTMRVTGLWFAPSAGTASNLLLGMLLLPILLGSFTAAMRKPIARATLCILASAALAQIAFYTFYMPAFWFLNRYFHFACIAFLLITAVALGDTLAAMHRRRRVGAMACFGLMLAAVFYGFTGRWAMLFSQPQTTTYAGISGAKGYAEVVRDALTHLPPGEAIGSLQSGALGYYAEGHRVLNLDGVVNHLAFEAIRDNRLGTYLAAQQVQYVLDWPVNIQALQAHYGNFPSELKMLYHAKAQGSNIMTLYRIITQ